MKVIGTKFWQWCTTKFDESDTELVYHVYKNIIEFDSKGKTRDNLLNSQKTHIKFLLDNVSKEIFLAACKQIKLDNDSGVLTDVFKKASSFRNYVLKFNPNYAPPTKQIEVPKEVPTMIPVRHIKVYNEYSGEDAWMNWHYKCSKCGSIYNAWKTHCKCGVLILWEEVDTNV